MVAAVTEAAARGTSYGAATAAEVELAEEVASRLPSVEMVRMTSSGTEAAMSAVRLARAVTGREVVVKFAGAYHGHSDGLLAEAGSGLATLGDPRQPRRHRRRRRRPRSSSPGTTATRSSAPSTSTPVAALLAEPVAANMGVVPPADGFLEFLRAKTRESGALLVFDEVITGFRVARGGAQELYGVEPDLTVMGKVLGGGLPAAAFGGPRETMERVAPAGDVYQAGTLSGNPLAVAAGLATLARLDAGAYERLAALTDRLAAGLSALAADRPLQVASVPGLLTLFFSADPVADFAAASSCDLDAHAAFCRAMLDARHLPAALAVRGLVRLPRPRRGRDRPHPRGRRRVPRRGAADERTADGACAARRAAARGGDADLAARGRAGRRRRRPTGRRSSTRSARATCSTTASRGCSPATTTTWRCSPATTSTRWASSASRRAAIARRCSSSPS